MILIEFAVDGGLEQFGIPEDKNGYSSTTGRGNGIQEVHLRDQTCEK